jgi:hypothetical protein
MVAAAVGGGVVALLHSLGVPLGGLIAAMVLTYPLALLALRTLDIGELRGVLRQRKG